MVAQMQLVSHTRPLAASPAPAPWAGQGLLRKTHVSLSVRHTFSASRGPLTVTAAVKVGEKAPDFALQDQTGKTVKLSQFQGIFGKPVVLYFYPADGTPGCTKQANAFKDAIGAFKKAGATVIGISGDDVESHGKAVGNLGLPFQLLADEGNEVRKQYGVPKDLLGLLEGRQTFVIDKNGTVISTFNNQFQPERHVEEALKALNGNA